MIEDDYTKYQKLLMSKALKWHLKTGVPYDELLSEGSLAFMECCNGYSAEKGSFITYLYTALDRNLQHYCTAWYKHDYVSWDKQHRCERSQIEEQKEEPDEEDIELRATSLNISHDPILERAALKQAITRMSEEAKSVVMLVLYSPSELRPFFTQEGIQGMRVALRRYLRHIGWSRININYVFGEIKKSLNTL
jgi:RNA polymerase sigma factor (sigma-70 family)